VFIQSLCLYGVLEDEEVKLLRPLKT